jgi:uncharacterized protein (TIGR00297 family)
MEPFSISAIGMSVVFCTIMALRAIQKQSLAVDGALIGTICGICIISSTLYRGLIFFYFYQIGSWCTKYNIHIKSQRDGTVSKNSQRNFMQVFCVSIIVTVLSIYYGIRFGVDQPIIYKLYPQSTYVMCAIIAHHATGLADTMASELGILVNSKTDKNKHNSILTRTVLITNIWKSVPPGTNGGITIIGCIWSCVGGMIIGMLTILTDYFATNNAQVLTKTVVSQYAFPVIMYATVIGCIGSCIDSLLGATCQATYYDPKLLKVYHANSTNRPPNAVHLVGYNLLTNEQVNLLSTAITCILGGWYIGPLIIP